MKRFLVLLAALALTFPLLPGCGGGQSSSPADQKKRLEESKAAMEKGMQAIKSVKITPATGEAKK